MEAWVLVTSLSLTNWVFHRSCTDGKWCFEINGNKIQQKIDFLILSLNFLKTNKHISVTDTAHYFGPIPFPKTAYETVTTPIKKQTLLKYCIWSSGLQKQNTYAVSYSCYETSAKKYGSSQRNQIAFCTLYLYWYSSPC